MTMADKPRLADEWKPDLTRMSKKAQRRAGLLPPKPKKKKRKRRPGRPAKPGPSKSSKTRWREWEKRDRKRKREERLAAKRGLTEIELFYTQVDRGTQDDDCWLWTGPLRDGRGLFIDHSGHRHAAHRWSAGVNGLLGDLLLHRAVITPTCGVPLCVNPDHLHVAEKPIGDEIAG